MYICYMKMTCLLRNAALNWPDALALHDGNRSISYIELERLIVGQARRLKRLGIQSGDRVGILARNSAEYAAFLFATSRLGASTVLLNPRHNPREWNNILAESKACLLLVDAEHHSTLDSPTIPVWVIDEDHSDSISRIVPADESIPKDIDTEQEATVVFTSGSSGKPKGVILTYVNHYFNALGSNENIPLQSPDCWLLSLPLCHVGGISILFRSALAGSAAYIMPRFDAAVANSLIDSGVVSHLSLVPTMLIALLQHRDYRPLPATVKAILLGGAPMPTSLIERARELKLPLLTSYGLTEAGSQVCTLSPQDSPEKLTTSGRPLEYRELRVVDTDGLPVPDGTVGEIAVGGEVLFKGYLGEETFDVDSWFHTGDMGFLDGDGYLIVCGRKDDMLISGGENIFPREIEAEVEGFPGITDCAVIGVPDTKWGERPVLFVEVTAVADCNLDALRQHLHERLARIKVPDTIIITEKLPRIGIGKVDKVRLMDMYNQRRNNQGAD
ncbi:MAG: o-succinylbenzoate--CoA ligase [Candidatus Zixiibacteriota bacterium]|nr:MAG: o-succinylbenzoate--CoA ligase [candidate division Zixibacteria bacterium]